MLVAELNAHSGESNYEVLHQRENTQKYTQYFKWSGLLMLSFFIGLVFFIKISNSLYHFLWIIKALGITVCSLLLWREVDSGNSFINKICKINQKNNCNDILDSKAARLTSWLSWAEIGFYYFEGTWLYINFSTTRPLSLNILFIVSLLGTPFVFYSLIYQGLVVKRWCVLCLSVQALLITEITSLLIAFKGDLLLKVWDIVIFLISLAIPVVIWSFLKPLLQRYNEVEKLQDNLLQFKRKPALFLDLLHQEKTMHPLLEGMETPRAGNNQASHTLTLVTNPFCRPCGRIHQEISKLIEEQEAIEFQFIFATSNLPEDPAWYFTAYLMGLAVGNRLDALEMWYQGEHQPRNLATWISKQPQVSLQHYQATLHAQWCDLAQIQGTPTLFWDGYQLPAMYQVEDLKYLSRYMKYYDKHSAIITH